MDNTTANRNPLVQFLALWKKQFADMFEATLLKNTLKVEVTNDAESIAELKQIARQLQLLNSYSQRDAKSKKPLQRIDIKTTDIVTLNKRIEDVLKEISNKELIVKIPAVQKMIGKVQVENFPTQYPFDLIRKELQELQTAIKALRLEVPPYPEMKHQEVNIPPFPKEIETKGTKQIIQELKGLRDAVKNLPREEQEIIFPEAIKVSNFPPQKVPQPVTNININPLRGFVHSTSVTVTTDLTVLPPEVLVNRRSLIVFNNSASTTVYIGGSEMSASDGLPVLSQTYSPVIDAGPRMIVYGKTASGSADVRVLEASNEDIGG